MDAADGAQLLALALSTPGRALTQAERILAHDPDQLSASYAHHAAAIVRRDTGDLPAAFRHLRAGLRAAQRAGNPDRATDLQATLGATLVMAGRTRPGLAQLDEAAAKASGLLLAKVRLRRAHVLTELGRHKPALVDLSRALVVARRSGDRLWEARIRQNRSDTYLAMGALGPADTDAVAAGELFDSLGQTLEAIYAVHNRAIVASRRGDIPTALRLLDLAESRYHAIGVTQPELVTDRGQALLAAGLAAEAVTAAQVALSQEELQPVKRAELALFGARAALAADQPDQAQQWAALATRLFRAQQRPGWQTRAHLVEAQARYRRDERSTRLSRSVLDVITHVDQLPRDEAPLAYLLAARLAHDRGQRDVTTANLTKAAAFRRRGSALTRATGWLAAARLAASTDNQRGLFAACGHGLDALDEHRLLFGAAEIRAVATGHARDLAALAIEAATRRGSARLMLQWTERSRATSLAEPSVRPTDDGPMERELAAVRASVARLDEAYASGRSTASAQYQRDAAEAAVLRRRRQLAGTHGAGTHPTGAAGLSPRFDVAELLPALGAARLVTLVESGGVLWALTAGHGRVRRDEVGPIDAALREINFARFGLRRAAYSAGAGPITFAERLQRAVLGPAARRLGDGPVIVVPPASMHAVPWGLLPALAEVPLSVSPSALMWARAAADSAQAPRVRPVLLVAGPNLGTQGAEVSSLQSVYPHATVLGRAADADAPATIEGVLASMSGAWVAHIAAHGDFRADSPLFSSLRLDDGALFVHDLDRLERPPRTVILSACDTGVAAPVGADELLGLVTGLLRVGTAGVLASVVPVNDEAAVSFMLTVHRALAEGRSLPEAALLGRRAATGDDLAVATAGSFTVWGA